MELSCGVSLELCKISCLRLFVDIDIFYNLRFQVRNSKERINFSVIFRIHLVLTNHLFVGKTSR